MMEEVRLVNPDAKIVLRVWWSIVWRVILYALAGGKIIGGIFGGTLALILGSTLLKTDIPDLGARLGPVFSLLASFIIGIWVTKIMLNKEYKEFRIALISKQQGR